MEAEAEMRPAGRESARFFPEFMLATPRFHPRQWGATHSDHFIRRYLMAARPVVIIALTALAAAYASGCSSVRVADVEDEGHPLGRFEERGDDPLAAARFRYQQRLSEDGTIPPNALMRAKAQRDRLIQHGFGAGVWPESWTAIGPGNIGGRLRPIVIDPTDPNIIYVGAASGGVWKTTDGGQWWLPLDDFLPSLAIGDMAMHPSDPQTLYAGTGEGFFETVEGTSNTAAVRGAGIFITHDGGATWNQIPSTANPDFDFVNRLEIDPSNPRVMLAATNSGIWRSTDGGDTWSQRSTIRALDVKFDPSNSNNAVAGGHHEHNGPYYSTDNGATWAQATGAGGHRQEMAYAPNAPGTVYAAVSGDNDRIRVWRSTDGGQTYALQTSGNGLSTYASYNNTIWVDPTNSETLVVGGVNLHRSTNGGVTFGQTFGNVHADMHRIVQDAGFDGVNNRTVYFACDGGIYRTANVYGSNAAGLNNNLAATQFYGAAVSPAGRVYGGTQDNGTLLYRGDPQDWFHAFGGDGGYGAADATDPNFLYGEVQRARIHRSTNAGENSGYIYNGPNPITDAGSLDFNFIPFFMLDPNNPNTMLVAGKRLWRSTNVKAGQPDWSIVRQSIEPPGPQDPPGAFSDQSHFDENSPWNIATIAVAEGDSDRIWLGYNNGQIWYTTNGTNANPDWTRVDEGSPLPDRWPSTIVIDPADHAHISIAFMGYEPGNVWQSADNGATWTNISGSGDFTLPEAPVSALAAHRTRPGWLYAGTDVGMFVSGDNGQSWSTSTNGPGTVPVEQLIWQDDDTLMAVTHGRGIFFADVTSPATLTDLTVIFGSVRFGGIDDLDESDDVGLRFRSQFAFQLIEPFLIEFILGAHTSAPSPALLDVIVESHVTNAVYGITWLRLRNWNTGTFDLIRQFNTESADSPEPLLDIPAANYVRASDGRIEVRIRQTSLTTFQISGFDSEFDRISIFAR